MRNIDFLFTNYPYKLNAKEKGKLFSELLRELMLKHKEMCLPYKRILEACPSVASSSEMEDVPMLPARLFKQSELRSISQELVRQIVTSSGTTSQIPSRIFLDEETSHLQFKAFNSVVRPIIGDGQFPMILVDAPRTMQDKNTSSIRGMSLKGWLSFSSDHLFLFDDSMNIKWKELESFLNKHRGAKIIIFGFTFMIWQHLYQPLVDNGRYLDLGDSIMFHTGGWKKLEEMAIDNEIFKTRLRKQLGINKIYNDYGMAELVGVIFMDCDEGYFHAPDFADVIIRDPISLTSLSKGKKGLIQILNLLAQSYPGHSLLTEDIGIIFGIDDCPCGRKGKYFKVYGRMPGAELRGCSDTYAYEYYLKVKGEIGGDYFTKNR